MTYNFKPFYTALRRLEVARQGVLRTPTYGNPSLRLLDRHKKICKKLEYLERLIYFHEVENTCTSPQD